MEGIDVIVGGHSHNRMKAPLRQGDTLIVHAGAHGTDLGRLDLDVREGRIVSHRRTLIPVTGDSAPDSAVTAIVARDRSELAQRMDEVVGKAGALIARAQTIAGDEPEPRDRESPADSLFADAIRAETGSEIALLPGVGYGVALQPGDITAAQLRNLIPHDSAVYTMSLRGRHIREALKQSVENVVTSDVKKKVGGMMQVSGLRFSYDPDAVKGSRVRDVRVDGRPRGDSTCHGRGGAGIEPHFPAIAPQNAAYTAAQLRAWKSGTRTNDPQRLMKAVADRLSDAEIDAVSSYLESRAAPGK